MRVIVQTDSGEEVGQIQVVTTEGPWTDNWQCGDMYEFSELADEAARREGGE